MRIYGLLAVTAMAEGLRQASVPRFSPGVHRARARAVIAMRGSGALKHQSWVRVNPPPEMAATAVMASRVKVAAIDPGGVEAWRWRDGTGRPLTWDELVNETKETRETRQEVQVSAPRQHSYVSPSSSAHAAPSPLQVHIGCDSAVCKDRVTFAIAVCVVSVGHAGRYFYARLEQSLNSVPVLQMRLLREVSYT